MYNTAHVIHGLVSMMRHTVKSPGVDYITTVDFMGLTISLVVLGNTSVWTEWRTEKLTGNATAVLRSALQLCHVGMR